LLLYGAAREIRSYWLSLAEAALADERRRLAGDLHDGIAQELTFMSGHISRIGRRWPEADSGGFEQLRSSAERAIAEARRAISLLRGPTAQSLDEALREVAIQAVPGEHPRLDLDLQRGVVVSPQLREALIRVVREALSNSRRHANASRVSVQLIASEGNLRIRVTDDGSGFDVSSPRETLPGFGLITMQERVRTLEGRLHVDSEIGRGTTVDVRIP
jgi:signal transduction histidine kinase